MTTRTAKLRATAAAAAGALLLAACGGAGGDGGQSASATSREAKAEDAMLRFTRCLRREGIDVGDAGKTGVVRIGPGPGAGGDPPNPAKFRRAEQKCGHLLRDAGAPPELSAEDRAEFERKAIAFARCMRKQGIDIPDPQVSGDGGIMQQLSPAANPQSARFRKAEEACRAVGPQIAQESEGPQ